MTHKQVHFPRAQSLALLVAGVLAYNQRLKSVHAKGLVGKLPGNPASCQEEPCNSDPQHVLAALKVMCMFLGLVLILPLLLYYLSKMFTKIREVCCPRYGHGIEKKEGTEQEDSQRDCAEMNSEQFKQQRRERGSQASNNLRGSISVISGAKDQGQFQLDNNNNGKYNRDLGENNQNDTGANNNRDHDLSQEQQLQQMVSRHQSLQYNPAGDVGSPDAQRQFARNQAQRESQRQARRQQRNSIAARMPGETRSGSRPTPPPQPLCDNNAGGDIDEREETAMMEAYSSMHPHPHRYSMYFGTGGGGGASGLGGCAVGVAAPVSLLHQQAAAAAIDQQMRRKSMRAGPVLSPLPHRQALAASRHVARATNPMSSSIKRKKARSGAYKIHPVANDDDGQPPQSELGTNKQPLARSDAIDEHQQAHYCSPTLSTQQQLLASDQQQRQQQNNNNNNNNHQRLRAGQSSPYAGASDFSFPVGLDKTNTATNANHRLQAGQANVPNEANLEVPSVRPEHRHSIDGSILNNMLATRGGRPKAARLNGGNETMKTMTTTTTTRQQQQQRPPISPRKCPEPFELPGQQQSQLEYQPSPLYLDGHTNYIHNQQQHQHLYQGQDTNNGQWQQQQQQQQLAPSGQLRPTAADPLNRRASLNAAALMRSPGGAR